MYQYSPLICRELLEHTRQMSVMLNGSQSQAFPLRATQHLGAENRGEKKPYSLYVIVLQEQEASLDQRANKHVFELLFPSPNLNPNPFPALQAPELTFPRLLSGCAFPHPTF